MCQRKYALSWPHSTLSEMTEQSDNRAKNRQRCGSHAAAFNSSSGAEPAPQDRNDIRWRPPAPAPATIIIRRQQSRQPASHRLLSPGSAFGASVENPERRHRSPVWALLTDKLASVHELA